MASNEEVAFGSDSFLDVMANMVGILIVLVVIGLMRSNQVSRAQGAKAQTARAEVVALQGEEKSLEGEVRRLARDTEELRAYTTVQRNQRDSLALFAAARKHELEQSREQLQGKSRAQFDLRRALAEAQVDLERVKTETVQKNTTVTQSTTRIDSFPTPISHTVTGHEVHFQLMHGRVCHVPMESLIKLFEDDAKEQMHRLQNRSEIEETLGPINGFRMRYTLERVDVPVRRSGGPPGSATRIGYGFTLIPVNQQMGETTEEALNPRSEFRLTIKEYNPRSTTVTLWTYPDSFALFRALKRELYLMGYYVAGRPLPEGQPIGASSNGTKSAAE